MRFRPFLFALPALLWASMAVADFNNVPAAPIASVDVFHTAGKNYYSTPVITFAGYHTPGDGGGGAVYALGAPGQTDNGGSILCDSAGNCFDATSPLANILQWGARGDAVNNKSGASITTNAGITTLTLLSGSFASSVVGNPIAVTGPAPIYEQAQVTSGSNLIFNLSLGLNASTGINFSGPYGIDKGVAVTSDTAGALTGLSFTGVNYCVVNTTANTHGTTTIDNISSTAKMLPGMLVYALGVSGIAISAVGANSITLASAAGGSHTGTYISVWGGWCATLSGNATASSATDLITLPNGTFYGTIASVNGASAVVTVPAGEVAPTSFTASRIATKVQNLSPDTSTAYGGSGFAVGYIVVLNDQGCATSCTAGTRLQVQGVNGSAILVNASGGGGAGINVLTQVALSSPPLIQFCSETGLSNLCPGGTGTYTVYQSDGVTPVANVGNAVINMKYAQTGQVWYGDDDTSFINAAYSSVGPLQNICLPSNKTFIITNTIFMPAGNNSVCGVDYGSSRLQLTGLPTPDANGNTYAVLMSNGVPFGGGARDFAVDAYMLANFAVGLDGGEEQNFSHIQAMNGTMGVWHGGDCDISISGCVPGVQIQNDVMDHVVLTKNFNEFPWFSSHAPYTLLMDRTANDMTVSNSFIQGNLIDVEDRQQDYNFYLADIVGGPTPFNNMISYEFRGKQIVIGGIANSSSVASAHLTTGTEKLYGMYGKWGDSVPSSTTVGVWIDNTPYWSGGADYDVVTGYTAQGNVLNSPSQNVVLTGFAMPNSWFYANPGATLVRYGPATPAACSGSPTSGFTVVGGIVTAC